MEWRNVQKWNENVKDLNGEQQFVVRVWHVFNWIVLTLELFCWFRKTRTSTVKSALILSDQYVIQKIISVVPVEDLITSRTLIAWVSKSLFIHSISFNFPLSKRVDSTVVLCLIKQIKMCHLHDQYHYYQVWKVRQSSPVFLVLAIWLDAFNPYP